MLTFSMGRNQDLSIACLRRPIKIPTGNLILKADIVARLERAFAMSNFFPSVARILSSSSTLVSSRQIAISQSSVLLALEPPLYFT